MWLEMLALEVANSPEGLHLWLLISNHFSELKLGKHTKRVSNFENEDEHPKFFKNNYVFTAVLVAPNA